MAEKSKRCSKCHQHKPLIAFSKNNQQSDGRHPSCKECRNREQAAYYARPEVRRRYHEKYKDRYAAEPELFRARSRRYIKKNYSKVQGFRRGWAQRNVARMRSLVRAWTESHREQMSAVSSVYYALKTGKLKKPDKCEACGAKAKLQGHHFAGYSGKNRLRVRWLCHWCHEHAHHGNAVLAPRP